MDGLYHFTVNGVPCTTNKDKSLLRFLRDDLHLHSVKDGCSEGACGTCTILVNRAAARACILTTAKAAGKEIVTVEGLSDFEKEAYVYAFGSKGAVQCGFCTPGMVMASRALLYKNPDPSEEDIKKALRGNICRCTGYKKIIDAVKLAAAIIRGEAVIDARLEKGENFGVGEHVFRIDVREKVSGVGRYPDDIEMPDMAYASAVRSAYPRARVLKIDSDDAKALPGVLGVLTAVDVPVNKVGHIIMDWDVMIAEGSITHCIGDAICLVVAERMDVLEEAKRLVRIEYEPLEPIRDIHEAMAEGAPKVHSNGHTMTEGNICSVKHVMRGNAASALAASAHKVTKTFITPFTEHAFLEPECAVAFPYKDGVKILSSDQSTFDTRRETAHMLGWDDCPERVVVENMLVGGGFGGKEDVSVQHLAALAAYHFQRPVKVKLSRQESINFHPKRHAMEGTFTLGCDDNGIFTALECDIYFDTGGYASLCGPVLERACTHAVGPYCYQNTDLRGYGLYTNNPPGGAFRGFGVCQSEFALESMIDLLADEVGISPWEIRYRNAIEPGKVLPNGQIADRSTALKETLEAVREVYERNPGRAGIACAMKNSGVGVGLPDKGRCRLRVEKGQVVIYSAASDIGQGCLTVFCQDVAEAAGLPLSKIRYGGGSTEVAPDSGTTSGSRQTLLTGEAVRQAAMQLAEEMRKMRTETGRQRAERGIERGTETKQRTDTEQLTDKGLLRIGTGQPAKTEQLTDIGEQRTDTYCISAESGQSCTETEMSRQAGSQPVVDDILAAMEGREFYYEYFEPTDPLGADVPFPKSHIAYGYATQVAVLDDDGRVKEIWAAHDAGRVVNPVAIEGQIEGGILMGMGYALTEDFPLKGCVPQAKYGTLGLLRATDIPEIHVKCVKKDALLEVAYGAKGVGEIAGIPTTPAIQNAYRAFDGRLRTRLPLEDTWYTKTKTKKKN